MAILDTKRDCVFLGPADDLGYLWAQQDGLLFHWSDSNVRYEECWWLNPDGSPKDNGSPTQNGPGKMARVNAEEKAFDPAWWSNPVPNKPSKVA